MKIRGGSVYQIAAAVFIATAFACWLDGRYQPVGTPLVAAADSVWRRVGVKSVVPAGAAYAMIGIGSEGESSGILIDEIHMVSAQ